mmetsp:Transcript_105702/g.183736  ORF Transcript_105702/g.183736 Transcript_105702/m.183736 type:complete len:110 (-) Transcript_105702:160-489(-)
MFAFAKTLSPIFRPVAAQLESQAVGGKALGSQAAEHLLVGPQSFAAFTGLAGFATALSGVGAAAALSEKDAKSAQQPTDLVKNERVENVVNIGNFKIDTVQAARFCVFH